MYIYYHFYKQLISMSIFDKSSPQMKIFQRHYIKVSRWIYQRFFFLNSSHQMNTIDSLMRLCRYNPMICNQYHYLVNISFYKALLTDMLDSVAINIWQPPLDLHLFFDSGLFNRFINGIHLDWVYSLRAANIICVKVPVAQRTQAGEGTVLPRAEEDVKTSSAFKF